MKTLLVILLFTTNALASDYMITKTESGWESNPAITLSGTDTIEGDTTLEIASCTTWRNDDLKSFNVVLTPTCSGNHFSIQLSQRKLDGNVSVKPEQIPVGASFWLTTKNVQPVQTASLASAPKPLDTPKSTTSGCQSNGINLYVFLITMLGLGIFRKLGVKSNE
jgi:hypothetical protein